MDLIEIIKSNNDKMTRSERAVGAYFLENPTQFAFETLDSIAEKINTSTTSVLRFCRKCGFDGYKALQEKIREEFSYKMTLPDKFILSGSDGTQDSKYPSCVKRAVRCIEESFDGLTDKRLSLAAEKIVSAKRVFCFGLKESYALAHYAYTRFLTVRNNVFILSAGERGEIESLLSLEQGDVCVFFLFHRYTKQSPEILKVLSERGIEVILITSPPYGEVEGFATVLLPCHVDVGGIKNSYAAPVCIADCLCNMAATKGDARVLEYMKASEELFKNFTF